MILVGSGGGAGVAAFMQALRLRGIHSEPQANAISSAIRDGDEPFTFPEPGQDKAFGNSRIVAVQVLGGPPFYIIDNGTVGGDDKDGVGDPGSQSSDANGITARSTPAPLGPRMHEKSDPLVPGARS